MLNNAEKETYQDRMWPQDTAVCSYRISIHSPAPIHDFLEYKKALDIKFRGKPYLIMLEILPAATAHQNQNISIEPRVLFRFVESLIACIKNGVHMIKFENPDFQNKNLSAGVSPESALCNIIADIIREICPSVLFITDMKQIQNDKLIIAGLNQFLKRSR